MGGAFDQQKTGHGNWHEIISAEPMAALGFYQKLFGWSLSREMQMGPDMMYRIFACNGLEIGGTFAGPGAGFRDPVKMSIFAKMKVSVLGLWRAIG